MRLTKEMKKQICRNAIAATFKDRVDALRTEGNTLALAAYNLLYDDLTQSKMGALPDHFFMQFSTMYAEINGARHALPLVSSRKVAASDAQRYEYPRVDVGDTTLCDKVRDYIDAQRRLEKDKETFRKTMTTFLAGLNTDKQLTEEWPEGSAYYADIAPTVVTPNVPAIRGAEINDLIGSMVTGSAA